MRRYAGGTGRAAQGELQPNNQANGGREESRRRNRMLIMESVI